MTTFFTHYYIQDIKCSFILFFPQVSSLRCSFNIYIYNICYLYFFTCYYSSYGYAGSGSIIGTESKTSVHWFYFLVKIWHFTFLVKIWHYLFRSPCNDAIGKDINPFSFRYGWNSATDRAILLCITTRLSENKL